VNSKSTCAGIGGYWFQSRSGEYICDAPIADAGKDCKDNTDCEGSCLADLEIVADREVTGHCDKWHIHAGRCVNEVRSGRSVGKVCDG
jgi:hypothetical protein